MWPHESFPRRKRRRDGLVALDVAMVVLIVLMVVGLGVVVWRLW